MINGRAWKVLSDIAKTTYLYAISDAIGEEARAQLPKYIPDGLSRPEVRLAIDQFYEEPENLLIPVFRSLQIVVSRAGGTLQPEIDYRLAIERRVAIGAPERKQ